MMNELVSAIIQEHLGETIAGIKLFPSGLTHYVYDVRTQSQARCVVRIARPERKAALRRGLRWQSALEPLGVPLAAIYGTGEMGGHAYGVYERLPGDDLENIYSSISPQGKKAIARGVAQIQQRVGRLEPGLFGEMRPWQDVLLSIAARSERQIRQNGICDPGFALQARQKIRAYTSVFEQTEPVAFLYDLNIRNVIVQDEQISGIIDVDDLWFGDPLLAVGRGKTILLAMRQDTRFITHWCQSLKLSGEQLKRVDFYAFLYCVRFMGTLGAKLNGNHSVQTDPTNAGLFESLAASIYAGLA